MNNVKLAVAFYRNLSLQSTSILNHSGFPAWLSFAFFGVLGTALAFTVRGLL